MREYELPNCPYCGGVKIVESYDHEKGTATIKELHQLDCPIASVWKKNYPSTPLTSMK